MAWPLTKHASFVSFITIILFKDCSGQQSGVLNQPNLNNPLGASLQNGLNIQNNLKQNTKCPIHQTNLLNGQQMGTLPVNLQQKLLQQAAAQEQFILQQAINSQNTNQPISYPQGLNVQQQVYQPDYIQNTLQDLNFQQHQQLTPQANFQQLNLQQQGSFPQQNVFSTSENLQLTNTPSSETSITSPPLTNFPFTSFNSQKLQQMPDLGIISPPAPSSSPSFQIHSNIEPNIGYPLNQQMPVTNIPSVIDISQTMNPAMSSFQIPDIGNINNQQQSFALVAIPIQNPQPNVPVNSQTKTSGFPNQVTIVKSLQPQTSMEPSKRTQEFDQDKLSLLSSLLLEPESSQISSSTPALNGNLLLSALSKQGSQSSNLKTILPLIFNLLKERNTGCSCHTCGCMNKNIREPQIFSGYANQNNYGYYEGKSQSNDLVFHDETTSKTPHIKRDYEKNNKINKDSGESDNEYFDSYEDEASKEVIS